jgi:enoyl-CoA hydratase/carnithine racemase
VYEEASKQKHKGASLHLCDNMFFLVISKTDFDDETIKLCLGFLEQVERSEGKKVLITTGPGAAKFFSTGFSLKAFSKHQMNSFETIAENQKLLVAFLTLNVPTLCVMQGTTLAGGLIMALCHDFRIMTTKAKVALSEIDVNLSIGLPYAQILHKTLGTQGLERTFLGKKLSAREAFDEGIVNGVFSDDWELERHINSFRREFLPKSENRHVTKQMKLRLHAETISELLNNCMSPSQLHTLNNASVGFVKMGKKPKTEKARL